MWTPKSEKTMEEFHPTARLFFSQPLNDELVDKMKDLILSFSQKHHDDRCLRETDMLHIQDQKRQLADMKECLAAALETMETIRLDEFMSLIDTI